MDWPSDCFSLIVPVVRIRIQWFLICRILDPDPTSPFFIYGKNSTFFLQIKKYFGNIQIFLLFKLHNQVNKKFYDFIFLLNYSNLPKFISSEDLVFSERGSKKNKKFFYPLHWFYFSNLVGNWKKKLNKNKLKGTN